MYKFIVFLLRLFKFYSKLSKSDSGSSHDSIFQGTRRSNKKNTPRNRNPIFSSGLPLSGHTLLKKYPKTRFRHLLFFFQSRSHGKHRKRSCCSWCCLMYHHFLLCQIIFQKNFKKFPIVYAHFLRIQYKQSANHIEFARCCICISFYHEKHIKNSAGGLFSHIKQSSRWFLRIFQ